MMIIVGGKKSMNNVSLIGRLTNTPELKITPSGTGYTRFSIAVDRRVKQGEEKQADFIDIVAWSKTAEFICKYFTKGKRIALNGSIRTGSYTAQDGTKKRTFEVWCDNVEFCDSKSAETTESTANIVNEKKEAPHTEAANDEDDLPF